jgi:hypothetical protein
VTGVPVADGRNPTVSGVAEWAVSRPCRGGWAVGEVVAAVEADVVVADRGEAAGVAVVEGLVVVVRWSMTACM